VAFSFPQRAYAQYTICKIFLSYYIVYITQEYVIDPLTIMLILAGLAINLSCFCFGVAMGRTTAHKLIKPYDVADEIVTGRCAKAKCAKSDCSNAEN
jgi:hypothetical protein